MSTALNAESLDHALEIVDFPRADGTYRVLQLYVDERPVLVCERFGRTHGLMLRDFLDERGMVPQYGEGRRNIHGDRIPDMRGDRYALVGAGRVTLLLDMYFTLPFDFSLDYDLGVDPGHRQLVRETLERTRPDLALKD